jgi:hypothetical protein
LYIQFTILDAEYTVIRRKTFDHLARLARE